MTLQAPTNGVILGTLQKNTRDKASALLQQCFPPLELETRPVLSTEAAAYYLGRKKQTLFVWACYESGPIRPRRVGRNLCWSTAEIKRLLGLE